ncbi:MAG: PKD domain-containing protein, partial [Phaeodactylibacter sp.]|nr:PKD domain-containing protein [Phaeodactylibacter sp.]
MKHAYLIVLLFFSISGLLSAQQPTFRGTAVESPSPEVFGRMFSEYRLFQIEAPILSRQAQRSPGNFRFQLNLGGEYAWPLALEAHDIRSGDYRLVAVGPEGEQQQPRSATRTFRGAVLGPQGGEARLTIDEHFLYGFVESAGETYYIEPAWPFDPTLPEDTYLVYPAGAVLNAGNYTCGWNEEDRHEVPEAHELPAPEAGRVILACYQVDIALAADFMMVQRFGSVTGVENFMLGVLNNVQTNFDNEFVHELFFSVATIFVSACSNCDPWTSSRSAGLLLDDFAIWGNSGGFGTNFDVASLWTDRDFFGDAIGVAWVGSVCTSNRYNILQNFSTNSALLRVLQAHELGHNFGTGHDAPGSSFIMAPSVNFTNTWSAQSRANINSFVNSLISFPGCLAACGSVAPPSPALAANVTSGCTPLVVNFSDISSGQVDDISWQFPGGSPSSSSSFSPTVTYNTPGTFDVILTVSNSGGANTIVMDNYITVALSPTPQFSYSANGLAVSFTNTSVNAQDFQWSFGDGDFSNATDPVHTFPADGLYLVALTTTNACGTFSFEEFVIVELPMQAGFSADNALGCAGSTVNFTDLSTGAPVAWQWAFEGGMPAVSDQPNPAVTYETPGAYDVSLTVTNAVGTTSNYVLPTYIAILPNPSAGFTYQYASGGLNVQFNNTSAGADDWLWDFGDGTTSSQEDPTHTYAADGNYTVTLTISSQCGTDEMVQNIEVATAPTAAFSAGVLSGCAPLEVQFANASSPNAGSFQWTFQGGTPASSTLANPVVSFNNAGDYTVTLVAANAAGSDTITQNITIEAGPQSNFTVDYAPGETEAAFSDQSGNADSLIWIFSNGTTSTEVNPTFDFGTDGVYPVTLVTVNACGSDTLTQLVEVVTPPTAAIGLGADFGCAPFTVQASDRSGSNTTTWTWAAPGATPDASDEQNPAFTFNAPGTYTITLVAANAAGQSSSSTTVTVGSIPEAAFAASTTLGQTALGLSNNSTDADSYLWDFGDGNTS